jgi:hypothetical protein
MQGTTNSATVRYLLETTNTNAAAATDEGAAKPESAITFTQVDEPVRKVATFLPVSDEMLEDMAQIRSYLDNRLRLFVQQAEEAQLLSGSGTAPNIRGLLNRTGIQTGTRAALGTSAGNGAGASVLGDVFFQAITNIQPQRPGRPGRHHREPGELAGDAPREGHRRSVPRRRPDDRRLRQRHPGVERLLGSPGGRHDGDRREHGPRRCVRVDGAGVLPQQPRRSRRATATRTSSRRT